MTRKPNDTLDHEDFAQDEVDAMLRSDFSLFAQATFGLVNQGVPLQWAPYLDLICATLQAVAEGKLLIANTGTSSHSCAEAPVVEPPRRPRPCRAHNLGAGAKLG